MNRLIRSVAARLYLMVGLSAAALAILVSTALVGSLRMADAGRALYNVGLTGMAQVGEIEKRFERLHGSVARVPAEPDLRNQQEYREAHARALAEIRGAVEQQRAQAAADLAALETAQRTMLWAMVAVSVLALLGAGGVGISVARNVSGRLAGLARAMRALAENDTSVEIPAADTGDEIGAMAQTVQVFKDNTIEMESLRQQRETERRAAEEKRRAMSDLADRFSANVGGVMDMVTSAASEMQTTAQSMSAMAEETTRQSSAVAAASEEASSNVQTVASAAEELSSSVVEIGRQVSESAHIAGKAVEEAGHTNQQVKGLAEAAQKIGEVVKLISDIAAQTNLLALNATIEAARAGEAGRGFAVVASEVKSLADQTAKATEEIAEQIEAMQAETEKSVGAIERIGGTINKINEIAASIASAVEEQGAATQEIAGNVQEAARGTQEVTSNIASVNQAASETGAAASQVLSSASQAARETDTLRTMVDQFLAAVRQA